jgi:hypothetical protein
MALKTIMEDSMQITYQTDAFKTIHHFLDQSEHFDVVRIYPIISTVTGIAETVFNTAVTIASLPIVLILQGIKILPGSERTHQYRVDLASDSWQFLKKVIHNIGLSILSSIPFVGNLSAMDFLKAQKDSTSLKTAAEESQQQLLILQQTNQKVTSLKTAAEESQQQLKRQLLILQQTNQKFTSDYDLLDNALKTDLEAIIIASKNKLSTLQTSYLTDVTKFTQNIDPDKQQLFQENSNLFVNKYEKELTTLIESLKKKTYEIKEMMTALKTGNDQEVATITQNQDTTTQPLQQALELTSIMRLEVQEPTPQHEPTSQQDSPLKTKPKKPRNLVSPQRSNQKKRGQLFKSQH